MKNLNIPHYLHITIKRRHYPYVDGMDFDYTVEQVRAALEDYRAGHGVPRTLPTEWAQYEKRLDAWCGYINRLKAIGEDIADYSESTLAQLRDTVDDLCPTTITTIEATRSGGTRRIETVINVKKAA